VTDTAGNRQEVSTLATLAAGPATVTLAFDGPYLVTDLLLFGAGLNMVAARAFETPAFLAKPVRGLRRGQHASGDHRNPQSLGPLAAGSPGGGGRGDRDGDR
jgi:hypothetical protein